MSVGPWQIVLIILLILVFFGPSRLPSLGKSVGEAIRGFKEGLDGGSKSKGGEPASRIAEAPSPDLLEDRSRSTSKATKGDDSGEA